MGWQSADGFMFCADGFIDANFVDVFFTWWTTKQASALLPKVARRREHCTAHFHDGRPCCWRHHCGTRWVTWRPTRTQRTKDHEKNNAARTLECVAWTPRSSSSSAWPRASAKDLRFDHSPLQKSLYLVSSMVVASMHGHTFRGPFGCHRSRLH